MLRGLPGRCIMTSSFDNEPDAGLSGERDGILDILGIDGWNHIARIAVSAASITAVGKTGHIVVVSRDQVQCMERCVDPLARYDITRCVVVLRQRWMTNGSWRSWNDESSRYGLVQSLP